MDTYWRHQLVPLTDSPGSALSFHLAHLSGTNLNQEPTGDDAFSVPCSLSSPISAHLIGRLKGPGAATMSRPPTIYDAYGRCALRPRHRTSHGSYCAVATFHSGALHPCKIRERSTRASTCLACTTTQVRTPVLCVKPSNGPIEVIFFKTLELPERDATRRGWKLFITTRVQGKADEFNSETIRLSPITSQTSDRQLDDVVAAIREFRAQALATAAATKAGHQGPSNKLDFQHLLASPDGDSRDDLPKCFTQSSVQTSALEVGSPFYVSPQAAGLYQPHYCAVPDDMYFYKCEDSAVNSCPAQGCGYGLASYVSALPSLSAQSDEERSESSSSEADGDEDSVAPVFRSWQLSNPEYAAFLASRRMRRERDVLEDAWYCWLNFYRDSWQRRFTGNVIEDDSDSECDLPRLSTRDFQSDSASCSDDSFIADAYESYEIPKRYGSDCSSCSGDSFESFGEDILGAQSNGKLEG
jgi:hypothetical protein